MNRKFIFLIGLIWVLVSCDLFKSSETTTYVVTDQSSNKVLSLYECNEDNQVIRTETYDSDQVITRARDFAYGDDGYVQSMTEQVPGDYTKTITYATDVTRDSEDRIEKITQTSSEGDVFESFFGYDDSGVLRGTVVRVNNDTVIMKDYDE